ncbi:FAST kinase domain-containing protein 4 [Temnothorax curvispinosus]|uniref:FAST kinase domain-containing protein 4 n=1 Tax=Temnothorax curvispinosus TaxID=300111 RepID=A0A6J1RDF6_9HYME|nr:FAST kinase domain-containing protein 4 [Temnothorax curvispinosus]XP_024890911.1 FAST kinase domain-containing protein 4 [Temnothorax curvispinosus]
MTMLQFNAMLCTATARLAPRSSWRFTALVACNSSTAVTGEQPAAASMNEDNSVKFSKTQAVSQKEEEQKPKETGIQTKPHTEGRSNRKKWSNENDTIFFKQFQAAKSVNDLLDLAVLPTLSITNALKLISSITNQINSGKSQMVDIETDERFIHLRKLVKNSGEKTRETSNNLSKYSQLSTPSMIAVIASLREQGKRNTPLLKMLSYNIVKYNIELDLKQCATLLYSMAVLNFRDKVLLEKITSDLLACIPNSQNAAINKSIITSLGFLRYKNVNVLDAFCDTFFKKSMDYTLLDYSSILQTFAALQYKSQKANSFIEKFADHANPFQLSWTEWLDIVWSLAVLDAVTPQHVRSVLEPAFIENLTASNQLNISKVLKLLNINAVAQFVLTNYKGPLLKEDSEFNNVSIVRSKEKQMYINALLETLTETLLSPSYFKTNFDTGMGFSLDAEYRINDQHRLVKVEDWNEQSNNVRRIGIMVHDYRDYCIGQNDLVGSTYLYTQLLKARGYNLIQLSYENFSVQDNIKKRINYLKQCMNSVQEVTSVKQTNSI